MLRHLWPSGAAGRVCAASKVKSFVSRARIASKLYFFARLVISSGNVTLHPMFGGETAHAVSLPGVKPNGRNLTQVAGAFGAIEHQSFDREILHSPFRMTCQSCAHRFPNCTSSLALSSRAGARDLTKC